MQPAECFLLSERRKQKKLFNSNMYMKKNVVNLCLLVTLLLSTACSRNGKSLLAPSSSGRPYEMLVIIDDSLWERPAGRALYDALDSDVPGLPQSERSFRFSQINEKEYSRAFSVFRNIVRTDIRPIYSQTKFKFARDVNASPQVVMTIQSPDEEAFAEYVRKNRQTIVDFFTRIEMNNQAKALGNDHSLLVEQLVQKQFDCKIYVPEELANYKKGKDFLWVTTNRDLDDLNLVIYTYPFTDKNTFTTEYFVQKRDSFMKANLPGPNDGSYMATDTSYIVSKDIAVRGKYAQEVKGLWAMNGAVMGGPYVAHVRVDEDNNRVIVAEVFVYSPGKKKRDIIRRMEAALYTLELPSDIKANVQLEEVLIDGVEEEPKKENTENGK